MSLHLYLNGGHQSMDGGGKGALGLLRERCKLNGLKIDQYDNYTGGYHLRPDSHWTYSFDDRGQVTGARKRTVTNVSTGAAFLLGGWNASYSYDDISNRTASRFGGDGQESSPVGSEEVGYEVNALNQYTEIENPRAFFVTGSAPAASTVGITLNGTAANRAVPHFWARQEVAGTGPTWADATLVATSGSSTVTVPKHTYVPPAVATPQYDADGNLVSDGRWLYAWGGENRLKEMTAQAAAVLGGVPELRLTFAYDGQSRRIRKLVEEKVSGSWVTRTDSRFVYDGWNLMAEVEYLGTAPDAPPGTSAAPRPFLRRTYLWGQDLSGSLQGAGGVGGLLAMTRHDHGAVPSKDYWVTSDLNGNVIGLINENGLRALYEYDPFGKPLRVSEPEEDLNPFRFSTKYTDAETGLCYYGYRYYDAVRGRWINRDPIEEEGGVNLYCLLRNAPMGTVDKLGLSEFAECTVKLYVGHRSDAREKLKEWNNGFGAYIGNKAEPGSNSWSDADEGYARASGVGCTYYLGNSARGVTGYVSSTNIPGAKLAEYNRLKSKFPSSQFWIGSNEEEGFYAEDGPAWNGGMNPEPVVSEGGDVNWDYNNQAAGFLKLVSDNWVAALETGSKLAKSCGAAKECCCKRISVEFIVLPDIRTVYYDAREKGLYHYSSYVNNRALTFDNVEKENKSQIMSVPSTGSPFRVRFDPRR